MNLIKFEDCLSIAIYNDKIDDFVYMVDTAMPVRFTRDLKDKLNNVVK